jgi:hypothetical protein
VVSVRDDFLRRYATSPIHVPRLERLLDVYDGHDADEPFARRFIDWDRACASVEAARIVTEILSVEIDTNGRIRRIGDGAVKGAIRWMADATSVSVTDRVTILADLLSAAGRAGVKDSIGWLEAAGTLEDTEFRVAVESLVETAEPRRMRVIDSA